MPGEQAPKGGRLLYAVEAKDLKETAAAINRNLDQYGKPIKVFLGHTQNPWNQKQQPELVGFGRGATVGRWGPKQLLAVLTDQYIERGKLTKEVRECPERSPEFYPGKNEITAVALLKTDPRLPMGTITYFAGDGAVLYGKGFEAMADDTAPATLPDDKDKPRDDEELNPDEAKQAMRYMGHYEKHHPVMKYMCAKYAEDHPSEDDPAVRDRDRDGVPDREDRRPDDPTRMHREQQPELMQALERSVVKMQQQLGVERYQRHRLEAEKIVDGLVKEGYQIKDAKKEIERFARLDEASRADRATEIRENYQRAELAPTGGEFIPLDDGYEGGRVAPGFEQSDIDVAVAYCEEKNLRPDDERQWEKAMQYAMEMKSKRGK